MVVSHIRAWIAYLRAGLSRKAPVDQLSGDRPISNRFRHLTWLCPFLLAHKNKWAWGAVLFLTATLLSLPAPLIHRYLIDDVILGRRLHLLIGTIALLVGISLAGRLAGLLQGFLFTRLEQEITLQIQSALFDRVLSLPKAFFDDKETGYIMSRLAGDVHGLRLFFSGTVVFVAEGVLRLLAGIGLLLYLEWRLAVGALILLPGIIFFVHFFSKKTKALSLHGMEQYGRVLARLQEALSSIPLIKAFSTEERTQQSLMTELERSAQISLEQSTVNSAVGLIFSTIPGLGRLLVLAVGAYWIIQGEWTLGSLLAFQSYLSYVYGPAQSLGHYHIQLQSSLAALDRVSALLDVVPEDNQGKGFSVRKLEGEIEFRDVSFSYNGKDWILKNLSFHLRPGEHVGIVGPSGVGKTTLLSLILRLYCPTQGEIYLDRRPASDYEVRSLRQRIGYVSQNTILLSGTVLDNLRYGNPDVPIEAVVQAAQVAQIHDFILQMPQGYDTEIGQKGVKLSEGQRQRLSLARALIKDPYILILDEPTASLDVITESSILEMLPKAILGKTLLIVSHRISTLKKLHRLLLLDSEHILATGTHESLFESHPYYRSLVLEKEKTERDMRPDLTPPGRSKPPSDLNRKR